MEGAIRRRARASCALAVALCGVAAAWFASSWIDDPPDSTCGSLWRADLWIDRNSCVGTMAIRGGLTVLIALLPVAAWLLARRRPLGHIAVVMSGCVAVAALFVLANEFVRSGGAWAG